MKKGKNLWIFYVIIGGVLLGGVGSIGLSSYLTEHLEGNMYNFDFDLMTRDYNYSSNDKIHIHNFVFYYDFTQNKGDVSFDLNNKNWSLAYITIEFPSVVDNKTNPIKIYTTKNGIKTDVIANITTRENYRGVSEINYTYLEISKFKRTFNDEKFVIEFKLDLQPKGRFGFSNSMRGFLHANTKRGNVNFVLGDDYECTGDCVYDLQYIEETPKSFDRDLKLKFKNGEENHYSSFKLNTINREIRQLKILSMTGGFLLIGVSLSFILGLLYKYGKEKDF